MPPVEAEPLHDIVVPVASDDLGRLLAEGWSREGLLASVLHSVRDNYLMRVVGQAKLGRRVCFQGAIARNKALVAAFEVGLQTPIRVSRFCHLTGALGVCLLLKDKGVSQTKFVGLGFSSRTHVRRSEFCSPILLAHGHTDWLMEKAADFVFFPIMLHGAR